MLLNGSKFVSACVGRWGIWVLAVAGILYQQVFHERFKMLETVFYLVIGILPALAVVDMVSLLVPCQGRGREKELFVSPVTTTGSLVTKFAPHQLHHHHHPYYVSSHIFII